MARQDITLTRTLDAFGTAIAEVGGPRLHSVWRIIRASAITDEATGSAQLRLYRNLVSPSTFLDGSSYARQDVAEYAPAPELAAGETLVAAWSEGAPGAQATLTLTLDLIRRR